MEHTQSTTKHNNNKKDTSQENIRNTNKRAQTQTTRIAHMNTIQPKINKQQRKEK